MLFPRMSCFSALLFTLVFFTTAHASVIPFGHKSLNVARSPSETWTNAQRLAAGLPPRAPRRLKRAPTPTEPGLAKRAAPSPSPSANALAGVRVATEKAYTGTLQVRTVADNATLGFVRLSSSGVELATAEGSPVAFTAVGSVPFSIAMVSVDDRCVTPQRH
ncbi:hypothetical protein BD309DRAFT_862827 [Dichomitus squalens]|uniref:Uncharacterized protein n=1 Tax=Dichomitus squalens TaxID=114155 RepID=A0A4Q9MMA4_9APHY|nr:hypothetical protein BD311DRAFT_665392 [Dichomitus squalens]TBU44174.1 hypothetical protein BD309DRAFT_862827 [Dichomitus squalens]TBU54250.1 hypothetical protein BD310DRAFT_951571 [Dichomitus squalens]